VRVPARLTRWLSSREPMMTKAKCGVAFERRYGRGPDLAGGPR
jgi:hypothetical protein